MTTTPTKIKKLTMLHKRDNTQTTLTLIILMEKESIMNAKDKHDKEVWMPKVKTHSK